MSLEEIEKELYGQKDLPPKSVSSDKKNKNGENFSDASIFSPWETGANLSASNQVGATPSGKKSKWVKVTVFFLSFVLLLVIGFAGFYLYQYFNTKGTSITVYAPEEVVSGVPFKIKVSFDNASKSDLISPKISLSLPDKAYSLDNNSKKVVEKQFENVLPNQSVSEEFAIVVMGEPLNTYEFNAFVSYTFKSSAISNRFERKQTFNILAKESILSADFSGPEKIANGEEFEMQLRYRNESLSPIEELVIKFDAPKDFTLTFSDPTIDNSSLSVKNLQPKEERGVVLSGKMKGKEDSFFNIKALIEEKIGANFYPLEEKSISVGIAPSPVSFVITNTDSDNIAYPGETLKYNLTFTNNSDQNLLDGLLKVKLSGQIIDFSSIISGGYFNDGEKSITWTGASTPELKEIKAKQSYSIPLSIKLKNPYPITKMSDKDFSVRIEGQISSPTVPHGVIAERSIGFTDFETKVGGTFDLEQTAYFKEPSSDIVNQGFLPPKVGRAIQYTIHWKIKTQAADFSKVKIRAFLPSGVSWTGKVKSNTQSAPVFNPSNQEVSWEIDKIDANKGVIEQAPEGIFQVEYVPSSNLIGGRFNIVVDGSFSATDSFVGKIFNENIKTLTSADIIGSGLPVLFDRVTP